MIELCLVALLGFVVLGFVIERQRQGHEREREAWGVEREGWIELVQWPDHPPNMVRHPPPTIQPYPDESESEDEEEYGLVGTIQPGVGELGPDDR